MPGSIIIRPALWPDLTSYIDLIQRTSQATYVSPAIGMTPDLFSPQVYDQPWLYDYLAARLKPDSPVKVWVAEHGTQLVGTIGVSEADAGCELLGLYVDARYQGQGIGHQLWDTARAVIGDREAHLSTYAHIPVVDIYKHWSFIEDQNKPPTPSVWPGLPPDASVQALYLRRPAPSVLMNEDLARAEDIKQAMSRLLVQLEETATGQTIETPGAWRHHPKAWVKRYPPTDLI